MLREQEDQYRNSREGRRSNQKGLSQQAEKKNEDEVCRDDKRDGKG